MEISGIPGIPDFHGIPGPGLSISALPRIPRFIGIPGFPDPLIQWNPGFARIS
jgi:hypothetical protein